MKTKSWKTVRDARLTTEARERVASRAQKELQALTLRELRQELDLTQQQVADNADMTQSELSRLESRDDHRVSTLRRYVEALGGELEISVTVGTRKLKLTNIG